MIFIHSQNKQKHLKAKTHLLDPYTTGGLHAMVTLLMVVEMILTSDGASVPDVMAIMVALGNHGSSGRGLLCGKERARRAS